MAGYQVMIENLLIFVHLMVTTCPIVWRRASLEGQQVGARKKLIGCVKRSAFLNKKLHNSRRLITRRLQ